MHARAVDDAGSRLRELRREEWSDLGLGAAALAAALVATQVQPGFAVPLLLGGVVVGARGLAAAWRRSELIDGLAGEPDAYVIDEVRAHALREATIERRRLYASYIRHALLTEESELHGATRSELEELAAELEDERLVLDPACAVACARLVSAPYRVALRDPSVTSSEVRGQARRIRAGFAHRPGGQRS